MSSADEPADRAARRQRDDRSAFEPTNDGQTGESRGGSRPSQFDRHGQEDSPAPAISLPTTELVTANHFDSRSKANRRLSYGGSKLRPDVLEEITTTGLELPIDDEADVAGDSGIRPLTLQDAVNAWREWYRGYENAHITYRSSEGEIGRAKLTNSHMPCYETRYYARLKGWERESRARYDRETLTTIMLTCSASSQNARGEWRAPADHMREIADGWDAARKMLHKVLADREWEYARVWEHHESGYGHQHIAIVVEDGEDLEEEDLAPVMRSYVDNCEPAGSEAHDPAGDAVSINNDIENLGSYISEYLGAFDGRSPLERPIPEQAFRATLWATQTRRIDFSNGAQEMIKEDLKRQQRERTGTRPEDRGGDDTGDDETATEASGEDLEEPEVTWDLEHIEFVGGPTERHQTDQGGTTKLIEVPAGPEGADPPKDMGPPKF